MYHLLKYNEKYRERRNKDRCIAEKVLKQYLDNGEVRFRADKAKDIIKLILNADREWRKILKDNPKFRGEDYEDGKKLAQQKQIDLGYEVGYNQDIKHAGR